MHSRIAAIATECHRRTSHGQHRRVLYDAHDECRAVGADTRQLRQPVEHEALVVLDIARDDCELESRVVLTFVPP